MKILKTVGAGVVKGLGFLSDHPALVTSGVTAAYLAATGQVPAALGVLAAAFSPGIKKAITPSAP